MTQTHLLKDKHPLGPLFIPTYVHNIDNLTKHPFNHLSSDTFPSQVNQK